MNMRLLDIAIRMCIKETHTLVFARSIAILSSRDSSHSVKEAGGEREGRSNEK